MPGLSFLAPLFLAGALAVTVPIILHLLRSEQAPRVPFSAVRFLRRTPVEHAFRHRLRELLLLALRVAAILLAALAFARPYLGHGESGGAPVTVVAVDTSFSMAAPGRFEQARALARQAIQQAPRDHQVAVMAFDTDARTVTAPTAGRAVAARAVDALVPGDGGTRYGAALSAAAREVGNRVARLVVVTDLQRGGWPDSEPLVLPQSLTVEIAAVDPIAGNVAVDRAELVGDRVVAALASYGEVASTLTARLTVNGRVLRETSVAVDPQAALEFELPAPLPREAALAVTIDDPVGYPADNTRHLLASRAASVLIVAGPRPADRALYLQRALAIPGPAGAALAPELIGPALLSTEEPGRLEPGAAVVILGTRGLDRRGREALDRFVSHGGGVLVAFGPDVESEALAELVGEASAPVGVRAGSDKELTLAVTEPRHPVFRAFRSGAAVFARVSFRRAASLSVAPGATTLARFSDGTPALIERRIGDGRLLLFASDLNLQWNDFPLQPVFAPFVHELVAYLRTSDLPETALLVGGLPGGLARKSGVVRLPGSRRAAVNVDTAESRLDRLTPADFHDLLTRHRIQARSGGPVAVDQTEGQQGYWRYLLACMVLVLAAEALVATRVG